MAKTLFSDPWIAREVEEVKDFDDAFMQLFLFSFKPAFMTKIMLKLFHKQNSP